MEDLLGIECNTNPDGSITPLHQNKYINTMINSFFTPEEREGLKKASTPYTTDLAQLVIEALEGSTASEPAVTPIWSRNINAWWAPSCVLLHGYSA